MTKETTIVVAKGKFEGKEYIARWEKGVGFVRTGDYKLDESIGLAQLDRPCVGGTYHPRPDTPQYAVAIFCRVFGPTVKFKYNGDIPKIPTPGGPGAIY